MSNPPAKKKKTASRITTMQYADMPLFNPEPFTKWDVNHDFTENRISDFAAAMCVAQAHFGDDAKRSEEFCSMASNYFNANR
ncbi:hypothetical protein V494_06819 [Pseudogymnoascus sp. VKM F-4513 (FW-928)]|nr:hypothetical protein V494_06819 [Pseudogymnoascus sp. VKM F-4513 (FW-928)]